MLLIPKIPNLWYTINIRKNMRKDILEFIKVIKDKYKMEAVYFPDTDVYSIRFRGLGIQNFNSKNFYDLPRKHREKMLLAILKRGLAHNLGEKTLKEKLNLNRKIGKKI